MSVLAFYDISPLTGRECRHFDRENYKQKIANRFFFFFLTVELEFSNCGQQQNKIPASKFIKI